jgi:hypothetical protein
VATLSRWHQIPFLRTPETREFLRRVHLDVTGRLPAPEVAKAFLDEPADMERLLGWGVDGLISNRPDVAVAVRDRHNAGVQCLGTRGGSCRNAHPDEKRCRFHRVIIRENRIARCTPSRACALLAMLGIGR